MHLARLRIITQEQSLDDARALADLASLFAKVGRFDEATATAMSIDHSRVRTAACGNVIIELIKAGKGEQARRLLADLIEASLPQDMGAQIQIIRLGDALADVGWLAEALTVGVTTSGDELPGAGSRRTSRTATSTPR